MIMKMIMTRAILKDISLAHLKETKQTRSFLRLTLHMIGLPMEQELVLLLLILIKPLQKICISFPYLKI
jgi:hypothetical protein